jgi:hypothetical protein
VEPTPEHNAQSAASGPQGGPKWAQESWQDTAFEAQAASQTFEVVEIPRWTRALVWDGSSGPYSPQADISLHLAPFPRPPAAAYQLSSIRTLRLHADLFLINHVINFDLLIELLQDHPNRPLVDSLRYVADNGFWPHSHGIFPEAPRDAHNYKSLDQAPEVFREMRDLEVALGRLSAGFESLQPGMVVNRMGLVPKMQGGRQTGWRQTTDQTESGLNDTIDAVAKKVRYDSLHPLGTRLLQLKRLRPEQPIHVWKVDVQDAFRLLYMHKLWQLKQVLRVDDLFHVDRCACFGGADNPNLFCSVISLVVWLAVTKCGVEQMSSYMDDAFGANFASDVLRYAPYDCDLPSDMVRWLELLDRLNIPHKRSKCEFGSRLCIIGHAVDADELSLDLAHDRREELVAALEAFAALSHSPSRQAPLRDFMQLAGWANWAFYSLQLGRPGLAQLYAKIKGKSLLRLPVFISKALSDELLWLAAYIRSARPLLLKEAAPWRAREATAEYWVDATPSGLGVFDGRQGFTCAHLTSTNILLNEMTAILAAVMIFTRSLRASANLARSRLLVHSDSLDSCAIFSSLRADPTYNGVLKRSSELRSLFNVDLRVIHISGATNVVADALSRQDLDKLALIQPGMRLSTIPDPLRLAERV